MKKHSSYKKQKKTRKGKIFYGCNNYPQCDFATWDEPINELCPDCGNILTKKGKKIKCSTQQIGYQPTY